MIHSNSEIKSDSKNKSKKKTTSHAQHTHPATALKLAPVLRTRRRAGDAATSVQGAHVLLQRPLFGNRQSSVAAVNRQPQP
jgi:hypothetical protein